MKSFSLILLFLLAFLIRLSAQTNSAKPIFRLTASYAGSIADDPATIYFDQKNSTEFMKEFDALKLMNTDQTVPNLYFFSTDTRRLSILGLPVQSVTDLTIPLGINAAHKGSMNLDVLALQAIPYTYVYLQDLAGNTIQELHLHSRISIQVTGAIVENRFNLLFRNKEIPGIAAPAQWNAYSFGNKVYIKLDSISGLSGKFSILSISGQEVYKQNLSDAGQHIISPSLSAGIYILSFLSSTGLHTRKIILGQ